MATIYAVSYTHLDVYKRQVLTRLILISPVSIVLSNISSLRFATIELTRFFTPVLTRRVSVALLSWILNSGASGLSTVVDDKRDHGLISLSECGASQGRGNHCCSIMLRTLLY